MVPPPPSRKVVPAPLTINIIDSQDVKTGRRGTLARVFAHGDEERRGCKNRIEKIMGV